MHQPTGSSVPKLVPDGPLGSAQGSSAPRSRIPLPLPGPVRYALEFISEDLELVEERRRLIVELVEELAEALAEETRAILDMCHPDVRSVF